MQESNFLQADLDTIRDRIRANLAVVKERLSTSAAQSGRAEEDVTLVVVSKTWPAEIVQAAVEAGANTLGENRVQEAQSKIPDVQGARSWHLIGHLQRNKAKVAVGLFDTIQSVDSHRLAKEISKHAEAANKEVAIHLQVNTSGEASKFGLSPEDLETLADEVHTLPGIRVEGLMTIATHTVDETTVRSCFSHLRDLRDRVCATHPGVRALSMGMTSDFEMAIEEGATHVRVGTAIFGQRN